MREGWFGAKTVLPNCPGGDLAGIVAEADKGSKVGPSVAMQIHPDKPNIRIPVA